MKVYTVFRMKHTLILFLIIILCYSYPAQSQHRHDVSVNLAPMLARNYSASYVLSIHPKVRIGLSAGIVPERTYKQADLGLQYIVPEIRFYRLPDYKEEWYTGIYYKFKTFSYNTPLSDEPLTYDEYKSLAFGLTFGTSASLKNGLTMNFWIGGGYNFCFYDVRTIRSYEILPDYLSAPVDVRIGVNVGWRFRFRKAKGNQQTECIAG